VSRCRHVSVVDPGPLTTVQDLGRTGWAHLGVPRAGALDRRAADLANRLVGNGPDAAVLETTFGGVAVRVSTAMTAAVTGAAAPVSVDGRPAAWCEPLALREGQTLRVGPAVAGVRSYVAFAGGIDVPPVLGSRSRDTLAGLGPPALAEGDELPVGDRIGTPHAVDVAAATPGPGPVLLRFVPGPRDDWFTAEALTTLTTSSYAVSADSNRIGLRLRGPALERRRADELPSEGIVLGAVQVPAAGEPLVFLNDHPTTGGYPAVGVVVPVDLPRCAQLRPGDEVRFARR
jgi:biotin-dependent carboxylase-like uncharacterized protein